MQNKLSSAPPTPQYLYSLENDWSFHSALAPPQIELFSDFDRKCQIHEFTLIGSCSIRPWSIDPPGKHLFSSLLSTSAAAASILFQAAVISFHLSFLTVHLLKCCQVGGLICVSDQLAPKLNKTQWHLRQLDECQTFTTAVESHHRKKFTQSRGCRFHLCRSLSTDLFPEHSDISWYKTQTWSLGTVKWISMLVSTLPFPSYTPNAPSMPSCQHNLIPDKVKLTPHLDVTHFC